MLQAHSFESELARYRPVIPEHRKIICRWREHNFSKLWRKILESAERNSRQPLDAASFINSVLSARISPERLIAHDRDEKHGFAKAKADLMAELELMEHPTELSRLLHRRGPYFAEMGRQSYDFNKTAVSRKNQNGSRDRRAFAARISGLLLRACGQTHDEIVAELMEIVFDLPTGASSDMVRLARRPSTKSGRQRNR